MDEKDAKKYVRCVMDYFKCNEKMANTILQSSIKNGEFNSITNMCTATRERRTKNE